MTHAGGIEPAARSALLALARGAIVVEAARRASARAATAPPLEATSSLALLEERRGAFVTLTLRARLRGCIGRVEPDQPLRLLIPAVACSAAFADPRFPPVGADELAALVVEISLLSPPVAVVDPADIVVGRHGLSVTSRGRRGLLLPQVAVEYAWSREEFLDQVCVKAGLPRGAWREPATRLHAFTAEVFSEQEE